MARDDGVTGIGTAAGGAALVVLALTAGLLLARAGGDPEPVAAPPQPTVTVTPTPTPTPTPTCSTTQARFIPTTVSFPGVARQVPVVALPRDADGIPGVPPISSAGKSEMAFDLGNGIRPGDGHGNALLNAHTWPDGSALGNKLLEGLHKGDRIDVVGPLGKICYTVNDRVEVSAMDRGLRYYAKGGEPQIAIVVCSGKRLGPGEWTKRTLWFASPVA